MWKITIVHQNIDNVDKYIDEYKGNVKKKILNKRNKNLN